METALSQLSESLSESALEGGRKLKERVGRYTEEAYQFVTTSSASHRVTKQYTMVVLICAAVSICGFIQCINMCAIAAKHCNIMRCRREIQRRYDRNQQLCLLLCEKLEMDKRAKRAA